MSAGAAIAGIIIVGKILNIFFLLISFPAFFFVVSLWNSRVVLIEF